METAASCWDLRLQLEIRQCAYGNLVISTMVGGNATRRLFNA